MTNRPARIVIFGATSAVASEAARIWAERGDHLFLVGRNPSQVEALAEDLAVRAGNAARIGLEVADLDDLARHEALLDTAHTFLEGLDIVLIAQGVLCDQRAVESNPALLEPALRTNALSAMSLAAYAALRLEAQGSGCIAAIGSVAGDRGRQSNFVYGAAKAALATFMEGLRNRLFRSGVGVLLVKPGFIDTPMTRHIENKGVLWSDPATVARGVVRSIDLRRDTVYLPAFWRLVMALIRAIPEPLFKRLKL